MAIYSETNGNELTLAQANALAGAKKIVFVKCTKYVPQPPVKVKLGPGEIDRPSLPLAVEETHIIVYTGADIPKADATVLV